MNRFENYEVKSIRQRSTHSHRGVRIVNYNGYAFTFGSTGTYRNSKVEMLKFDNVIHWDDEYPQYPFAPALAAYSSVTIDAGVVIVGGGYSNTDGDWITTNQVALFDIKFGWQSLGKVQYSRHAHSSIVFGNSIYVIGGKGV